MTRSVQSKALMFIKGLYKYDYQMELIDKSNQLLFSAILGSWVLLLGPNILHLAQLVFGRNLFIKNLRHEVMLYMLLFTEAFQSMKNSEL